MATGKNPSWTRDELIIALDLYLRHRDKLPAPSDPEITTASVLLNKLSGALGSQYESFRNANSVYMKLANFRGIDPQYTSQGKKGLERGGKGDREVWDDFTSQPKELALAAAAIRQNVEAGIDAGTEPDEGGITEAAEGRLLTRMHLRRERNAKLVAEKKK